MIHHAAPACSSLRIGRLLVFAVSTAMIALSIDKKQSAERLGCRFVDAAIQSGRTVLDPADSAAPTRVRHAGGDVPVCNLYDASGLPAGPFEVAIQQ
jgi:hypothetical protein